ncbi:MAG: RNA polymerase sigma factor [Planctomycetes bacterium]|nr:RNA polymerase sigma factor [Planctomycetota bacterium]
MASFARRSTPLDWLRNAAEVTGIRRIGPVETVGEQSSDEALLAAHMDGHPSAFPTLVERYRPELYGFLCRFIGSRTAAEDVFQDTFLQIHLSAASFDMTRVFRPWLYTIAANKARDWYRKERLRRGVSLQTPIGEDGDGELIDLMAARVDQPATPLTTREESELVNRAVDALSPLHREIIVLAYFQRMNYQQIAEILGIPLGTVKSRLHAAVAAFAERWRRGRKDRENPIA